MSKPKPRQARSSSADHEATVRVRYPDAFLVEGDVLDLKRSLAREDWSSGRPVHDARARVRGFLPDEHAAQAGLLAALGGSFPTVYQVRARRWIAWSDGTERDCDEEFRARGTLIGEGRTPRDAWKAAAGEVGRSGAMAAGKAPMLMFRVAGETGEIEWKKEEGRP
jgi:hypothetical protein